MGCNECNQLGYKGRVGVYELLKLDGAMTAALRDNDIQEFAEAAQRQLEFDSLASVALSYAVGGITTLDEVIRIAGDVEEI